jgi:hypothetical protein
MHSICRLRIVVPYGTCVVMISQFQIPSSLSNICLIAGTTFNVVNTPTTLKVFICLSSHILFEVNYILHWLRDVIFRFVS